MSGREQEIVEFLKAPDMLSEAKDVIAEHAKAIQEDPSESTWTQITKALKPLEKKP